MFYLIKDRMFITEDPVDSRPLPVFPAKSLPSAPAFAGETGAGNPLGAGCEGMTGWALRRVLK